MVTSSQYEEPVHDETKGHLPATEHEVYTLEEEKAHVAEGDDSDGHVHWTWKQALATLSLCGIYVGSQVPLYFVGGSLGYIAADIGGNAAAWLPVANSVCLASVCPFVGYLQDMFGRRNISILGSVVLMVGIIVVATAHSFGQGVAGMAIAGGGATVGELTALAGTAEMVPVRKRGLYLACVTMFVTPFFPYVLYAQLLAVHASWRWGLWISLIYNGIFFIGVVLFYWPNSHILRKGTLTRSELLKRIDYVGAGLSIAGITLFLVALQSGGYTHPWKSAYVLATLIIGAFLLTAFVAWEWKGARYPMVPGEIFKGQRVVGMAFVAAFVSGMDFYSVLNFLPLTYSSVYDPDPVQVGLKGLGYATSISVGAAFMNAMLTVLKGRNREVLVVSCVLMTAFSAAMAAANPTNPKTVVALGTVAGFGIGGVIVPAATIAMTACPDSLIATTTALTLSVRFLGGAIGYSIYYNVFIGKLTPKLPEKIAEFVVAAGLPTNATTAFVGTFLTDPTKLGTINGVTPAVVAAATMGSRWAYAEALSYVWYTSIPFGCLAIVCSMFIGDISRFMTNRIAVKIER